MSNPLEAYMCKIFKVNDLYDISWYDPQNTVRSSEVGRLVTASCKLNLSPEASLGSVNSEVFQPHPKRRFCGQEVDLQNVCMQNVMVKGYSNPNDMNVGIRCNTLQRELVKSVYEYDMTKAAAYGRKELAGVRMVLDPNAKNVDLDPRETGYFMPPNDQLLSSHIPWVKCTGLVNQENLSNYTLKIPREVCLEQVEWAIKNNKPKSCLSLWIPEENGPQEPPVGLHTSCWYALPMDHLISTFCYAPSAVLQQKGVEAHLVKFRRGNGPIKGFFLMTDLTFKSLQQEIITTWLARRDIRPLSKVAFQAVCMKQSQPIPNPIQLDVVASYVAWPRFDQNHLKRVMPTCNADLVALVYYELYSDRKQKDLLKRLLPKK